MSQSYNPLHLLPPHPPHPLDPTPIPSAITIDPYSDILWLGSSSGSVASLCSPLTLTQNIKFPAHGAKPAPLFAMNAMGKSGGVKEIRVTDREIWTLGEGGLGGRRRGGAPKWSVSDTTRSLRCFAPNPTNSHELLAGGTGPSMMLVNTSRGDIVRRPDQPQPIVHMASLPRSIVAASSSGQVTILDPRQGFRASASIKPVQAHTGGLSGADAQGNVVCTWGWSHMQGHPLPDPMVKLYDVRTLRALPPISFAAGPSFACIHPRDNSKVIVASAQGVLQVIDMSQGSSTEFQQLDVSSFVTCMTVSPAGDYLAFGDADGQVHLWTTHDTSTAAYDSRGVLSLPPFNGYPGIDPEWPDDPEPLKEINWQEVTPLNTIGMPHYSEPLLSNIPSANYAPSSSPFYNPQPAVPNNILNSMRTVDFVGYATMPKELKGKRNQVVGKPGAGGGRKGEKTQGRRESEPRFRSEKERAGRKAAAVEDEEADDPGGGAMPKIYRKVEIKYSRFGVEDFDFGFYNRTQYSGLETHIANSYTNSLLQALHYTQPFRSVAKAHVAIDCTKEHCLLCESGFLFRMLEDAKGINCQASNFSRAFSATPQAAALGLLDGEQERAKPVYAALIQNFNRWLLSTVSTESNIVRGNPQILKTPIAGGPPLPTVSQVVGIPTRTTSVCSNCGLTLQRDAMVHVVELSYPRRGSNEAADFASVLQTSIARETITKAVCQQCRMFVPLHSRRLLSGGLAGLPPVISVNVSHALPEHSEIWKDVDGKRYIPTRLAVASAQSISGFSMTSLVGEAAAPPEAVVYEVRALVVQVQPSADEPSHLISFIKVPNGEWFVFNDFLVRAVSEQEALSFTDWKEPAIILLERVDSSDVLTLDALPQGLDTAILSRDVSIAWNRRAALIKHSPLDPEELPTRGTLISIDAEFVALQQEELEFRSDGTKKVLRPSHMSLARVSVLRGEGPREGVPFIDDYIHTSEPIVDYLTEYSGIRNGDLDPNNSPHTLVPLKVAYKKLRLLVDLGCVFIGHGLSKDFRTINIFVPPEQVLDTVNIYFNPARQRKLSLRFLSWFLLKQDIQTQTHDSIEDAKGALLLYKLYLRFEEEGRFDDVMEDIFIEGRKTNFKPPATDRPQSPAGFQPTYSAPSTPLQPSRQAQQLKQPSSPFVPTASAPAWAPGPPPAFNPNTPARRW